MYNEEVAMKVEALAQERGVRAIVVVEEAIASFGEQIAVDQLRCEHQEELQAVVSEVRIEHIKMQRKIIERDARIAELDQLVQLSAPEPLEHNFSSWEELADTVQCGRTSLLKIVKTWSLQERQALSTLLAEYLGEEQDCNRS